VKALREILDQGPAIKALFRDLKSGRVKHAYLFTGPDGVGKHTTALAFARSIFCGEPLPDGDSCGQCRSCRLMDHGNHPGLYPLGPDEKKSIRIDVIREVQHQLGLKLSGDTHRVILMNQAGQMTTDAANCLLKSLEEPPQGTIFLLVADGTAGLPETIISRTQTVYFGPLSEGTVADLAVSELGLPAERAGLAARLSGGSIGDLSARILRLEEAQEWLNLQELLNGLKDRETAWYGLAARLEKLDSLEDLLNSWTRQIRENLVARVSGKPAAPEDRMDAGEEILLKLLDVLLETGRRLKSRVNTRLALDAMLINMQTLCLPQEETHGR